MRFSFFLPELPSRYDGSTNPLEFLQLYTLSIQAACGDHRVMANWFPMALKEAARAWLMNLPAESISSWKDLCDQFIANFMATYERPASKYDLKAVRQRPGKTLHAFIQRFIQVRNRIPRISNEEIISAFSAGVTDIRMREKLSINVDLTSVVRLFEIADRCAKAEEGRLFVCDAPEVAPSAPPAKNKSKEYKRKESAILAAEPERKHHREDRAEGSKDNCLYYVLHKKHTHNTEDCYELKKFHEELDGSKRRGNGRLYHEIAAVQPSTNAPRLKWSQYKISFDANDHPKSTRTVGTIPLVCTPTINNIAVTKTLIDGGAGLNVISVETFEKMQVPYDRLMPTRPFFGVTDGSTTPLGQVRLPVTFGMRDNYRTEYIDFDITHIGLPYNAILGYPALAKFMAVAHHAYNIVKLPGCGRTITIRCDKKDALRSIEHVYKEAATAFPTDEDLVEHSGGLARRKQLVSQEGTAAAE
ncbi:hypothetical protein ACQ4PT_035650 [Festuca glaucescens]